MEHIESCICGSTDLNVLQKINAPATMSEMQCAACGYTLQYPSAARPEAKTKGEVYEELVKLWNRVMIDEKLKKELQLSEQSFLKEELVTHLLKLTSLLEAAEKEGVPITPDTRKKVVKMLTLVQRLIPAMAGLESASTSYFKEALDVLLETKGTLKFSIKPKKAVKK